MASRTEIDLWQGEIAELEVDGIVVPSNESLFMTTTVGRAVRLRAGESVEREAVDQGPVAAGSAVVTGAGKLPALHLIHAVGVGHDLTPNSERLRAALQASFEIAGRMGLHRLAMAPIGTERGVFTADEAAAALVEVVSARGAAAAWLPDSIVIAISSPGELAAYRSAVAALRAGTP